MSEADATAPRFSSATAPSLQGERVLVTGGTGFLGVNLVHAFAEQGAEVVALVRSPPDDDTHRFLRDVAARVSWVLGDVTDRDGMASMVADEGVNRIVHAAAVTATPAQERRAPARVFDVNAGGTLNLLEAARKADIQRFVFVSSGGLYGAGPPEPALTEEAPVRTESLYAIAKAASEQLIVRYRTIAGLDAVIGRLGTTYGPMERTTGSRTSLSAVQQAVVSMRGARPGGRPVTVRGADVARDFLHVSDAADAFTRLVGADDLGHHVYNVGAPVAASLSIALDALAARTGAAWSRSDNGTEGTEEADIVQTPSNARPAMDMRRARDELGWRFRYDLATGSIATLNALEHLSDQSDGAPS